MSPAEKRDVIQQLQKEVLSLQGFDKLSDDQPFNTGLGPIEKAFPGSAFPTGAIHEFLSYAAADAASTSGFIVGLLGRLMQQQGACLWVSTRRTLFPPALKVFSIAPERIIFIDVARHKEALWTIEEALKCNALSAVVGEIKDLSFTESRRLQLAVEESHVTGFIHRNNPGNENAVACVSRWKIRPLASIAVDDLPGLGFPCWDVQLQKVRNGKPGTWQVEWANGCFRHISKQQFSVPAIYTRKTG